MKQKLKSHDSSHPLHFSELKMQDALLGWYGANKASHPWRLHWEKYRDPYAVWISEIMLQQTTLAAMIPIYEKFMFRFGTLRKLASAQEEEIKKTVQGLGYYRRFSLLHKGAQKIIAQSPLQTVWPRNYEEWLSVPGVGDYTAAALSSITLNESVPVLDGNVIRVLCRLFDIRKPSNDGPLKKELKTLSSQLISKESPGDFNQGIMELGQKICRPLSPSCEICPVKDCCLAFQRKSVHLAPQAKTRREPVKVQLRIHIFKDAKRFGLVRRPMTSKFLRGTAGFLTEIFHDDAYRVDGLKDPSPKRVLGANLGSVTHSITHHSIRAEVFLSPWLKGSVSTDIEWYESAQLGAHLVSSLDMKAWRLVQTHLLKKA